MPTTSHDSASLTDHTPSATDADSPATTQLYELVLPDQDAAPHLETSTDPLPEVLTDEEYARGPEQDWCEHCDAPRDIEDTSIEVEGAGPHGRQVDVILLSCGHHLSQPMHYVRVYPELP